MATLKDDPYELIEEKGISKAMLSEKSIKTLELYDKAASLYIKRPASQEFKEQAEKAGRIACGVIAKDIESIQSIARNDIEETHVQETKKAQSKTAVEKSEQILDDLEICRQKLKEDRQRKIASGEIALPKKKTLVAKLRQDLVQIVKLIPDKLKTDTKVIERTERALKKFLNELKDIWGITKVQAIEDDINEKIEKLKEHAA